MAPAATMSGPHMTKGRRSSVMKPSQSMSRAKMSEPAPVPARNRSATTCQPHSCCASINLLFKKLSIFFVVFIFSTFLCSGLFWLRCAVAETFVPVEAEDPGFDIRPLEDTLFRVITVDDSLRFTDFDAGRVAVTEIAFHYLLSYLIEGHAAEGADGDAGFTADTFRLVDQYPVESWFAPDGVRRAGIEAGSILAVLAGDGDEDIFEICLHDPDTALAGVGNPGEMHGTGGFAIIAAIAFLVVQYQYFCQQKTPVL